MQADLPASSSYTSPLSSPSAQQRPQSEQALASEQEEAQDVQLPQPEQEWDERRFSLLAQEWLHRRFLGIRPSQLCHEDGVLIYSAASLTPPAGFEDVWHVFEDDFPQAQIEIMKDRAAILLVANPHTEADRIRIIATKLEQINHAPPVLWVPHSFAGQHRGAFQSTDEVFWKLLDSCINDVICGEPKGMSLALAINSKIQKQRRKLGVFETIVNEQDNQRAQAQVLHSSLRFIVWDHLRHRLRTGIPPEDPHVGIPDKIDNLRVHANIGQGSYADVYSLLFEDGSPSDKVVKFIRKKPIPSCSEVGSLSDHINIMFELTNQRPHRNLIKLFRVFHTRTHVLLYMENGGSMDLRKRLSLRDVNQEHDSSLSRMKVAMLIQQAIEVMDHLHRQCRVAHLDIKPENVIVREEPESEDIILKLIDFDAAMICEENQMVTKIAGTFPFIAPEAFIGDAYEPFPADIWSLGVLILEILCELDIIQRVVFSPNDHRHHQRESTRDDESLGNADLTTKVSTYFTEGVAEMVLEANIHHDLLLLREPMQQMIGRMVNIRVEHRLSTTHLVRMCRELLQSHLEGEIP